MSFGKSKSKAEQGISQAGSDMYKKGEMTPQEISQYEDSFDLGKLIEDISKYQMGLGKAPEGYVSPTDQFLRESGELGTTLYNQTLAETKDPYAFYESTLEPSLQISEDYINRQAQKRGLLRSGIPIEEMGRAGVELAVKEAEARQRARADALNRTAGLTEHIGGSATNRLAGLTGLYGQQQQLGLNAFGRQSGQAQAAAAYQAYPYQARLGDIYGRSAALYELPGQVLGTAGTILPSLMSRGGK